MKNILLTCFLALVPVNLSALDFTPGYQENIPSKDAADRTFKLYIPPVYADAEKKLPILFVSSAGANPNIKIYKSWADQRGIIVVGIDSSRNGPSQNNIEAQDACVATLWNKDTPDKQIRASIWFAAGMSGGAQASWLLALRYANHFGGVLMCGQGGHDDLLAPHISVAYIHGDKEPNNSWIDIVTARLLAQKNNVSDLIVPGGHVAGTLEQQLNALNWCIGIALTQHPSLSPADRKANALAMLAVADSKELSMMDRIAVVEDFLRIPGLDKSPLAKDAYKKWAELAYEQFQTYSKPAQQYVEGTLLLSDPRISFGDHKTTISDAVREAKKDDTVKPELKAVPYLQKLRGARASGKVNADELKKLYASIIEKYTGTYTAELAAKDVAEL